MNAIAKTCPHCGILIYIMQNNFDFYYEHIEECREMFKND